MSLFIQEKEKLTDLVSEKGTRLIETLEIDTLYFIKSHLYYNALWSQKAHGRITKLQDFYFLQ